MLYSMNTLKFNGTNIIKTLNSLKNIVQQFLYLDNYILKLFKQCCTTPGLATTVNSITAGQYLWKAQKEELLAFFKSSDQTCHTDPTKVIKDIICYNPLNNLKA